MQVVEEIINILCDYISSLVMISKVKKDPNILDEIPRNVINKLDLNYFCELLESKNIIFISKINKKNFGRTKTRTSTLWGKCKKELQNRNYNINNLYIGFNLWLTDKYIETEQELKYLLERKAHIEELYNIADQLSPKFNNIATEYKKLLDVENIKEQLAWSRHFDLYLKK